MTALVMQPQNRAQALLLSNLAKQLGITCYKQKARKEPSAKSYVPNATTLQALQELDNGEVVEFKDMDDFKQQVHAL